MQIRQPSQEITSLIGLSSAVVGAASSYARIRITRLIARWVFLDILFYVMFSGLQLVPHGQLVVHVVDAGRMRIDGRISSAP
jgi:heme/copper-type cytochrome/quinol oxidase subunit 3